MSSFQDVLVKTVAPALGVLCSEFLAFGPLQAILKCRQARTLGEVNPTPFPLLFGNGIAWVMYGVATKNAYVFLGNVGAVAMSLFYLLTAHTLTNSDKVRMQLEIMVIGFVLLWCCVGFAAAELDEGQGSSLIGILGNIVVFFLFASPLSTMPKVMRTRDSSSINKPFAICQVMNCVVWVTYGLATNDYYVATPNFFGLALGIAQIMLLVRFPKAPTQIPVFTTTDAQLKSIGAYSSFDVQPPTNSTSGA